MKNFYKKIQNQKGSALTALIGGVIVLTGVLAGYFYLETPLKSAVVYKNKVKLKNYNDVNDFLLKSTCTTELRGKQQNANLNEFLNFSIGDKVGGLEISSIVLIPGAIITALPNNKQMKEMNIEIRGTRENGSTVLIQTYFINAVIRGNNNRVHLCYIPGSIEQICADRTPLAKTNNGPQIYNTFLSCLLGGTLADAKIKARNSCDSMFGVDFCDTAQQNGGTDDDINDVNFNLDSPNSGGGDTSFPSYDGGSTSAGTPGLGGGGGGGLVSP